MISHEHQLHQLHKSADHGLLEIRHRIVTKSLTNNDYESYGCQLCIDFSCDFYMWWDVDRFNWVKYRFHLLIHCNDNFYKWYDPDRFFNISNHSSDVVIHTKRLLNKHCETFRHVWYKDYLAYKIVVG